MNSFSVIVASGLVNVVVGVAIGLVALVGVSFALLRLKGRSDSEVSVPPTRSGTPQVGAPDRSAGSDRDLPETDQGAFSATPDAPDATKPVPEPDGESVEPDRPVEVPPTFKERFQRARSGLSGYLASIRSRSVVDSETWDDLEEALIRADVGVAHTSELMEAVRSRVAASKITESEAFVEAVKAEMIERLSGDTALVVGETKPSIWLFVGVNGVGKTTTIGKVGHRLTQQGKTVVMAAGDTFRAAAAEQLETWANRCGAQLVRGNEGADPSSVIFDGVAKGHSVGADVVLADTAGRLHTKNNLMDELRKVRRVSGQGEGNVDEVLLVLDATTGQNGLAQARQFAEAAQVTGIVLTKLDGSAKGGIVYAISQELGLPIKLVGLGESAVDLVDFDAQDFVNALFDSGS